MLDPRGPTCVEPENFHFLMGEGEGYIGNIKLISETLFYLFEIEEEMYPIFNPSEKLIGSLLVRITPSLRNVDIEHSEYENMHQIVGKWLDITMSINRIANLSNLYYQDVFCSYKIPQVENGTFITKKVRGDNADFCYSKTHSILVTKNIADEFQKGFIVIKIYGSTSQSVEKIATSSEERDKVKAAKGAQKSKQSVCCEII